MDLKSLPKIDLHHHLDGAIRVRTILDLGRRLGVRLPADTVRGLRPHVTIPTRCRSLTEFLAKFETFYPVLRSPHSMERIGYEVCEDQARDGVIYVETRYAPTLSEGPGFDSEASVRASLRGLRRGMRDFGVRAGLILCLYRGQTLAQSMETVRIAARLRCAGVDLAGDEIYPAQPHAKAFALARRLGLPITCHAGEAGSESNIRRAIGYGARRIGHGIKLDGLIGEVKRRGIAIENCLTSNLQTGQVRRLRDHPFHRFFREGVRVTLNTDDPGVSLITLSGELRLARREFSLTRADLMRLQLNAVEASFAPPSLKRRLARRIEEEWR